MELDKKARFEAFSLLRAHVGMLVELVEHSTIEAVQKQIVFVKEAADKLAALPVPMQQAAE